MKLTNKDLCDACITLKDGVNPFVLVSLHICNSPYLSDLLL
uniref:Uncharacterized protein n=1 Tax=Arundo donax TaxID=35708 RepID=A0A0A8XR92_ARUDO